MPEKCLLLLDSYSGQKDDNIFECNSNLKRLTIPPKTTDLLQPCDIGLFRYCKLVSKTIHNYVILEGISIDLSLRDNICKMWSLIYNQFNSDLFTNFLKNAWVNLDRDPIKYKSPDIYEILFEFDNHLCDICNGIVFIKCSHCKKHLCFNDFFIKYHFHK